MKEKIKLNNLSIEKLMKILIIIIVCLIILIVVIVMKKTNTSLASLKYGSSEPIRASKHIPEKLEWFDSFKGIENNPSENASQAGGGEKPQNFLDFESKKNR